MTRDTRQNQPGARLRLAFLSAIASLVAAFAASASLIPVYNTYRAEQGLTNADISLTVVAYFAGTITALLVLGRLSNHLGRRPVAIDASMTVNGHVYRGDMTLDRPRAQEGHGRRGGDHCCQQVARRADL